MARIAVILSVPPLLAIYIMVLVLALDTDKGYTQYLLLVPVAYIMGSIPWGFMIALAAKGVDIREYGSGKTGVSNVMRTVGGPLAGLVLLLDLGKGILAVFLARGVADSASAEVVAGLAALAGHNWSVFLNFHGGRGINTGLGGLLVMAPVSGAIAMATFAPVTLLSRYLSLGSVISLFVAFFSLLALVLLDRTSATYLWYGGIGCTVILWQHRDNIQRLLHGSERRLGQPADRVGGTPSSSAGGG